MSRVCCYLTSPDFFYSRMVLNSVSMLRSHNPTIKVKVFIVGNGDSVISRYADRLAIHVERRDWTDEARRQNYFCLNRQLLSECEEESVLHIDGDTFIFDDIEKIFNRYNNVDFAAAQDDWIIGTSDWDGDDLLKCYRMLKSSPVPVFNGGLTLWNGGTVKSWCNFLPGVCKSLHDGEFPLPWLTREKRDSYHKETFAICLYVALHRLSYAVMDQNDVVNLFGPESLAARKHNHVVFHCFTQNWKRFAKQYVKITRILTPRLITETHPACPTFVRQRSKY